MARRGCDCPENTEVVWATVGVGGRGGGLSGGLEDGRGSGTGVQAARNAWTKIADSVVGVGKTSGKCRPRSGSFRI